MTELLHPVEKVFGLGDSLVIGIVHSLQRREEKDADHRAAAAAIVYECLEYRVTYYRTISVLKDISRSISDKWEKCRSFSKSVDTCHRCNKPKPRPVAGGKVISPFQACHSTLLPVDRSLLARLDLRAKSECHYPECKQPNDTKRCSRMPVSRPPCASCHFLSPFLTDSGSRGPRSYGSRNGGRF